MKHRDIPLEEFEYTLNVNLRASFVLVKGVVGGMKAQKWGRIIFMSSIAAQGGGINGCRQSNILAIEQKNKLTRDRLCSIERRLERDDEEPCCQIGTAQYLSQ